MRPTSTKIIFFNFLLALLLVSVLCSGQERVAKDTSECLEISGFVTKDGKPQKDILVKLWLENEEVANLDIKKQYKFKFKLKRSSTYTIEVSKPGYVTRLISVSTKLPPEASEDNMFRFSFEMELLEQSNKLDPYYSDFPSAFISYNSKLDGFQNDAKYSQNIKKVIYTK